MGKTHFDCIWDGFRDPELHRRGGEPSTGVHACSPGLLLIVDVMWPVASGSCCLDFWAKRDCSLECWARFKLFSFNLLSSGHFVIATGEEKKAQSVIVYWFGINFFHQKVFYFLFTCNCLCLSVCYTHVYMCPWRPEENVTFNGAGVTMVLWKEQQAEFVAEL